MFILIIVFLTVQMLYWNLYFS